MPFLLVACGGALGAVLRYLLMNLVGARAQFFGVHLPYSTLLVNILGSFILGLFITYIIRSTDFYK